MELLMEIAGFAAKTFLILILIVVAALLVSAIIGSAIRRNRVRHIGQVQLTSLNDHYRDVKDAIEAVILDKKARKRRKAERKMERALIRQYEADMKTVLASVTDATRDAVLALAALPMDIRGFGPVKQANEAKAAKRREELLAVIRSGGTEMKRAAE